MDQVTTMADIFDLDLGWSVDPKSRANVSAIVVTWSTYTACDVVP